MKTFATLFLFFVLTLPAAALELDGNFEQGGLVIGKSVPGARAMLDGNVLDIDDEGVFAFGFDRDHGATASLVVSLPDGGQVERELAIAPREWKIQRVEGVPQQYVTPPPEAMEAIARSTRIKNEARKTRAEGSWFREGFIWPATGPISGVFGSQRFYNGEPRRPHYGVDVAAPTGTPIVAPAGGVITLAGRPCATGRCARRDWRHWPRNGPPSPLGALLAGCLA